jgi:hypothetical protein
MQRPPKCSSKCLQHTVTTLLQRFKGITGVRVPDSFRKMFNSYGFSIEGCGELFHCDYGVPLLVHDSSRSDLVANVWCASKYWDPGLVVSHLVAEGGFEHQLWDPGLSASSKLNKVARFWVNFASRTSFHWDLGLAMGSKLIEITRSVTDFHYATLHWLANIWLLQQKCGGANTLAYMVCLESEDLIDAQLSLSVAYFNELSSACIVFKISTIEVLWCSSAMMSICWLIAEMRFSGCVLPLSQAPCITSGPAQLSVIGQKTRQPEKDYAVGLRWILELLVGTLVIA